jgi:hypothetical protein
MDSNEKIDEAIEYVKWLLQKKDPEGMFSFLELRSELLSIIGYLTLLKTK